jgi:hypothetical protein
VRAVVEVGVPHADGAQRLVDPRPVREQHPSQRGGQVVVAGPVRLLRVRLASGGLPKRSPQVLGQPGSKRRGFNRFASTSKSV